MSSRWQTEIVQLVLKINNNFEADIEWNVYVQFEIQLYDQDLWQDWDAKISLNVIKWKSTK